MRFRERMQLMREVAAYKVKHRLPVEDLEREKKVLAEARKTAQEADLVPQSVEPFISALMEAGKTIQYRYLADWPPHANPAVTYRDLAGIRQRINELDRQLLTTLSQRLLSGAFTYSERVLLAEMTTSPNLSEAEKDHLLDTLRVIQRAG